MLYIHIPFCEKKCAYCDFLSFCANDNEIDNYIDCLCYEIKTKSKFLQMSDEGYTIQSTFIGGGTPSILQPQHICKIFDVLYKNFNFEQDCEISIEANPNSLNYEKCKCYIENGINRISIGLQTANDDELKTLGRIHTYKQFLNAYNTAQNAGFNNINIDLIKNIPNQTSSSFEKTLTNVINLSPSHISVYDLIVEKNTLFHKLFATHSLSYPSEDAQIKIDNILYTLLENSNYIRYEISNFAKDNKICKHNLGYWTDIPYLGFGLGSSSYFKNERYKNEVNINSYMKYWNNFDEKTHNSINDILYNSSYEIEFKYLTSEEKEKNLMNEYIMLSMRTIYGANKKYFYIKFKKNIYDVYGNKLSKFKKYLIEDENSFHFTKKGFDVSNQILSDIML